jgi:hypothetical protein
MRRQGDTTAEGGIGSYSVTCAHGTRILQCNSWNKTIRECGLRNAEGKVAGNISFRIRTPYCAFRIP